MLIVVRAWLCKICPAYLGWNEVIRAVVALVLLSTFKHLVVTDHFHLNRCHRTLVILVFAALFQLISSQTANGDHVGGFLASAATINPPCISKQAGRAEWIRNERKTSSPFCRFFPQTGKVGCVNYQVIKSSCFQEAVSFNGGGNHDHNSHNF